MEGWIKLHRQIMENPDYLSEPFTRIMAWVDLLLLANHKEGYMRIRGNRVVIKRGYTAISQETLSTRWKWSRGKVTRYLNELEKEGQIVQRKSNIINSISIVNYTKYQTDDTADSAPENQQTDSRRTADSAPENQQTDTNKNDKKNKNVKNDKNTHTHNDDLKNFSRAHAREGDRAGELLEWIATQAPYVAKMELPLRMDQAEKLVTTFAPEDIKRIFLTMCNKPALTENRRSAYATFHSLANLDFEIRRKRQAAKDAEFNKANHEAITRGMVKKK